MTKTYDVKLTLTELEMLDGKVSEIAQKVIELAKKENSFGFSLPIMNEILRKSEEKGKLTWTYKQIRSCSYCDKKYDYHRYPRNGRYHNKGDKNRNKPMYYSGIEFNQGFVNMVGYGDMCSDCCNNHNVLQQLIDYIIDNDLKIEIQKNNYRVGKYLKDDVRICFQCDHEMPEHTMGREPTLMGDGSYPATCPKCKAKSGLFGANHKVTSKFVHIDNPAYSVEVRSIKEYVEKYNKENEIQLSFFQSNKNINRFIVQEKNQHNSWDNLLVFNVKLKQYHESKTTKKIDLSEVIGFLNGYKAQENSYRI